MSIGLGVTKVITAASANINSAAAVLLTYYCSKPCVIQRFGAVGDTAAGIPAATRLKVRRTPITTGAAADLPAAGVLNPGGLLARGVLVTKTPTGTTAGVPISAGDILTVVVDTVAGAAATANVWLEIVELPFSGSNVPATAVKSA